MSIEIEKILTEKDLKGLSKDAIKSINESLSKSYSDKIKELDKETSDKFNSLVEGMSKKFDEHVNVAITESVKANVQDTANSKLYGIIKGMVNLLENSGITTTEKTKELQVKLSIANEKLEESFKVREEIKEQLEETTKESYIMNALKGMKLEIVNAALEYFKVKDMLDVQDELQTFIEGDFSNLDLNSEGQKEFAGELDIEQVRDALDEIDTAKTNNKKRLSINESVESRKTKATFESLGKGLRPQKVGNSGDITKEQLDMAETLMENAEAPDADTKEALDAIENFNDIGYNFK